MDCKNYLLYTVFKFLYNFLSFFTLTKHFIKYRNLYTFDQNFGVLFTTFVNISIPKHRHLIIMCSLNSV